MDRLDLIERLKINKQKSKQFNAFGEDCHAEIDKRIDVLENDLTRDEAEDKYDFDITDVYDVMDGEMDVEDILYPEVL